MIKRKNTAKPISSRLLIAIVCAMLGSALIIVLHMPLNSSIPQHFSNNNSIRDKEIDENAKKCIQRINELCWNANDYLAKNYEINFLFIQRDLN